jgi:hypothetical protein
MNTIGEIVAEYVMTAINGATDLAGGKYLSIDVFVMAVSANKSVNVFLNNDGHALLVDGCLGVYCCMIRVHPP